MLVLSSLARYVWRPNNFIKDDRLGYIVLVISIFNLLSVAILAQVVVCGVSAFYLLTLGTRGMAARSSNRRICFVITEGEKHNHQKLVHFAKSLPKTQPTGDKFQNSDVVMTRDAFSRCSDTMWRHPEVVMQCENWLAKKVVELAERGSADHFNDVSTLKALEEE
jgi:hypothetical protein